MKRTSLLLIALLCTVPLACGSDDNEKTTSATTSTAATGLPRADDPVRLDPANFTTKIDNPYFPLAPGTKWTYLSKEEKIVVAVTRRTKDIQGVKARVITDVVTQRGGARAFVEVTRDWYAQDKAGNVWYLGEDTKEYEEGKVSSTEGSWQHGVDGAYAGVIMPADPRPGTAYRQEYYKGEAEDRAKVLRTDAAVEVPFGTFTDAVETDESTPLEPGTSEHKYYARDVGHVLRTSADGGGREELVRFTRGG